MNEDYVNVDCPEVKEWFDDYQNHLSIEDSQSEYFDESQILEPFVEMERSCSSIDQAMLEIESILRKTFQNVNKVASCTSNSQFYAKASLISANIISASNNKQDTGESFLSRFIGIVHSFSNWFFGFFDI